MSLLAVKALNQSYGGSHTLWDVDLTVAEGSRTCLMGRNGMGKTTLLKCIMGLLPSTAGQMAFAGTDLRAVSAEARARLGIGFVHDNKKDHVGPPDPEPAARGKMIRNSVNSPGCVSTSIDPPCCLTTIS